MNRNDYIKIILTGYFTRRDYLSEYFYRELKSAEKSFIGAAEFLGSLTEANGVLIKDIQDKKLARINEVALMRSILESEGKSTEDLIGQENIEYSINLLSLSGGKFTGQLWITDLSFINEAIVKVIGRIRAEIDKMLGESENVDNIETQSVTEFPQTQVSSFNIEKMNKSFSTFNKRHSELRKKFRVKVPLTKEEAEKLNIVNTTEGYISETNPPIPNDPKAAFELFKNYYAAIQFEYQKHEFEEIYQVWNEHSIKAELKVLEEWIQKAKSLNYKDAVRKKNDNALTQINEQYEYLRLNNEFYLGYLMTWDQHNESSLAATVYGRYILFYEYLRGLVYDSTSPMNFSVSPSSKIENEVKQRKNEKKFSNRQIAIAFFFLNELITKENGAKILAEYSHNLNVAKLLSKRISKVGELTSISENKTKDTKHLRDLEAAKRMVSGKKNNEALKSLNAVITAFVNNYKETYQ